MTPSMLIAVGLGVWMLVIAWPALQAGILDLIKIALVALVIFHFHCGRMITAFAEDRQLNERFFRIYNELRSFDPRRHFAVVKPF